LDQGEMGGYGVRATDGTWSFQSGAWSSIVLSTGAADAGVCAAAGADTAGVASEFARLNIPSLSVGDVVMLYRQVHFRLAPSALAPGSTALYRGNYGESLAEFATGLSAQSRFEYRRGDTIYYPTVSSANLPSIDGIRFVAEAQVPDSVPGGGFRYGWTVTLPLRNAW
ncbi:MAG: hypothetical protein D6701_03885, partial [Gemmatimonadetes bacterium]